MSKLKELRSRIGLTQKQVAERLETTQQTVQRWESGQTEIPAAHLKDLSVLFGCSIDELLGVDAKAKRRQEKFARSKNGMPWGSLRISFAFGERRYPIDEDERDSLEEDFHSAIEIKHLDSWVRFRALDNRLVFINPTFVSNVESVTDDEEEMPFFASPEAYKALSQRSMPLFGKDAFSDIGPVLKEECTQLMANWNLGDAQADFDRTCERLNALEVITATGKSSSFHLSDDVATSVFLLENETDIKPNSFVTVSAWDGNYRAVNLSSVAAIEVPIEAYFAHLAKDSDQD